MANQIPNKYSQKKKKIPNKYVLIYSKNYLLVVQVLSPSSNKYVLIYVRLCTKLWQTKSRMSMF